MKREELLALIQALPPGCNILIQDSADYGFAPGEILGVCAAKDSRCVHSYLGDGNMVVDVAFPNTYILNTWYDESPLLHVPRSTTTPDPGSARKLRFRKSLRGK